MNAVPYFSPPFVNSARTFWIATSLPSSSVIFDAKDVISTTASMSHACGLKTNTGAPSFPQLQRRQLILAVGIVSSWRVSTFSAIRVIAVFDACSAIDIASP